MVLEEGMLCLGWDCRVHDMAVEGRLPQEEPWVSPVELLDLLQVFAFVLCLGSQLCLGWDCRVHDMAVEGRLPQEEPWVSPVELLDLLQVFALVLCLGSQLVSYVSNSLCKLQPQQPV
jgi:hypothetical protein